MTEISDAGVFRSFDDASVHSAQALPNERLQSSLNCGWRSLLVERQRSVGESDVFETAPTPDQTVVVALAGEHELGSARASGWKTSNYREGSVGLTAGGETSRLRWRGLGRSQAFETAHLYLPNRYVVDALERFTGSAGTLSPEALTASSVDDPLIAQTVRSLVEGMESGYPDLYAEAAAQWLAVYLVCRAAARDGLNVRQHAPEKVTDRRLERALEIIRHRFAEPLSIDTLAAAACISKYHFVRVFTEKVGVSPHEYLVNVRMTVAKEALARTDRAIADIARDCGYERPATFSTVFARVVGMSPRAYRQAAHR